MTTESSRDDPLNRQFDALRHPLRRRVLVATAAAPAEAGVTPLDDETDSSLVELHHVHLPRLAEVGYVEWESDPLAVGRGPAFDEIEPLLDLLDDAQDEFAGDWPDPPDRRRSR